MTEGIRKARHIPTFDYRDPKQSNLPLRPHFKRVNGKVETQESKRKE
jgi:hypothetical protein